MSAERLPIGTKVRILGATSPISGASYHMLTLGSEGTVVAGVQNPDGDWIYTIDGVTATGGGRWIVHGRDLEPIVATEDTSTAYKPNPLFEELLTLRAKLAEHRERFPETDGHVVRSRELYMRKINTLEADQIRALGEYVERATTVDQEVEA